MSSSEWSYSDYYNNVRGIAKDIREEFLAGNIDDVTERISEECDGSSWVIYTAGAINVLLHSQNDDAIFEQFGKDAFADCSSMSDVYTRAAYYALFTDVSEALGEFDDWNGVDFDKPETDDGE